MCDTDIRQNCYGNPLSLLKNCDATALGKLCDTVSGMGDDAMDYAHFPKRSLVKCFSARVKYEWHVTQTAQLEEIEKRWSDIKEQMTKRTKPERRQQQASDNSTSDGKRCQNKRRNIIQTASLGNKDAVVEDVEEELCVKRGEDERMIKAAKQSPCPVIVDEDILREALMVAEHFAEGDVPCQVSTSKHKKSEEVECTMPEEASKIDVDKVEDDETGRMESNGSHQPRSGSTKLKTSSSITTPRQRPSAHIFPSPRNKPSHLRSALSHNDRKEAGVSVPPATASQPVNATTITTPRRNKLTPRSNKTTTPSTTPRKTKKAVESPKYRNARSTVFRGAFGGCLGSKHASVDFSSPRTGLEIQSTSKRHFSTGPASTRKLFGGNRAKKSTTSSRSERDSGSFGATKFRTSAEFKASKPWK